VIDGSGEPRFPGDLAISGDRIAALGRLDGWRASREVDASGLVAAPGFIDAHTHDDLLLLTDPAVSAKASQGVTTVIAWNCWISLAPLIPVAPPPPLYLIAAPKDFKYRRFAEYLEELDAHPAALNAAFLVGHSTLRVGTMNRLDRPASDTEIAAMRTIA